MLGPDNQVVAVEYDRHGTRRIAMATKEIILSAGAVNTPKIMMLSGIGPKDHLESLGVRTISYKASMLHNQKLIVCLF